MKLTTYEDNIIRHALRIAAEDGSIYSAVGEDDGAKIVDDAITSIMKKMDKDALTTDYYKPDK